MAPLSRCSYGLARRSAAAAVVAAAVIVAAAAAAVAAPAAATAAAADYDDDDENPQAAAAAPAAKAAVVTAHREVPPDLKWKPSPALDRSHSILCAGAGSVPPLPVHRRKKEEPGAQGDNRILTATNFKHGKSSNGAVTIGNHRDHIPAAVQSSTLD